MISCNIYLTIYRNRLITEFLVFYVIKVQRQVHTFSIVYLYQLLIFIYIIYLLTQQSSSATYLLIYLSKYEYPNIYEHAYNNNPVLIVPICYILLTLTCRNLKSNLEIDYFIIIPQNFYCTSNLYNNHLHLIKFIKPK